MTSTAIDMTLLGEAVRALPGDALDALRRESLAQFRDARFPDTRQEDWKYTNLAPAAELSNAWLRHTEKVRTPTTMPDTLRPAVDRIISRIDAHWIVFANGAVDEASLQQAGSRSQRDFKVRSAAAGSDSDVPVLSAEDPMSRFNAALLRDVLHIEVGAGRRVDKPVGLMLIDDAGDDSAAAAGVSQYRIVIEVAENAQAQFIELHASRGKQQQFANSVVELRLAQGARVDFLRLQERDMAHYQVGRLTARLDRDAVLKHAAFDLGGALIRNDIDIDLASPGAAAALHGLYLASGRQHIDNHTRIDHRVGPTTSTEEYRGILAERARCVFNGKALVHAGADGTDARQSNHNLLLSDGAEIDSKPELEIYANDVKCSHGATVGQLDANALFYLRSRGLDKRDAARALTRAFAARIVDQVPVRPAHAYLEEAIEARLITLIDGEPR